MSYNSSLFLFLHYPFVSFPLSLFLLSLLSFLHLLFHLCFPFPSPTSSFPLLSRFSIPPFNSSLPSTPFSILKPPCKFLLFLFTYFFLSHSFSYTALQHCPSSSLSSTAALPPFASTFPPLRYVVFPVTTSLGFCLLFSLLPLFLSIKPPYTFLLSHFLSYTVLLHSPLPYPPLPLCFPSPTPLPLLLSLAPFPFILIFPLCLLSPSFFFYYPCAFFLVPFLLCLPSPSPFPS